MRIYAQAVVILPDGQFMNCHSFMTNVDLYG